MVLDAIFMTAFIALLAWAVFTALRDGHVSYGHVFGRKLYVCRDTQPRSFWAVVAFATFTAVIGLGNLVAEAIGAMNSPPG